MLGLIIPWWGRALAVVAVLVAAAAFGAVKMHQHDQKTYDALQAKFDAFQDQVLANGLAAKAAVKVREADDKKRKDQADNENSQAIGTLAATIAKLRNDHPAGGGVPKAAPGSKRPDLACFDRSELIGALERYRGGTRAIADEGSAATVNLDSAKRWAQSVK